MTGKPLTKAERAEWARIHEAMQEITAMLRLLLWYRRQKAAAAAKSAAAMTARARRANRESIR